MIQDNENTIFSIGASALQSAGPSRERLKSVSSAFGMSNFTLMPIDNPLLEKAERNSQQSWSATSSKDALSETVSIRAGSQAYYTPPLRAQQPPMRQQGNYPGIHGAEVGAYPLLTCNNQQATAWSPHQNQLSTAQKPSTLSANSAKKQQDGYVDLYRKIWKDFQDYDCAKQQENSSLSDVNMDYESYVPAQANKNPQRISFAEELSEPNVVQQLSANQNAVVNQLHSQDPNATEAIAFASSQQVVPVEDFAGNCNSTQVKGLSIFSVLANNFTASQDDTKEQRNDAELTQFALGLAKSFHENKLTGDTRHQITQAQQNQQENATSDFSFNGLNKGAFFKEQEQHFNSDSKLASTKHQINSHFDQLQSPDKSQGFSTATGVRSLLHEYDPDDIDLLMPRNQVDEEYGEESDNDVNDEGVLYYFERYGEEDCEEDEICDDCQMDTGMYGVETFDVNYGQQQVESEGLNPTYETTEQQFYLQGGF